MQFKHKGQKMTKIQKILFFPNTEHVNSSANKSIIIVNFEIEINFLTSKTIVDKTVSPQGLFSIFLKIYIPQQMGELPQLSHN